MIQTSLFPEEIEEESNAQIVNVASVPQRSPFRYPGGKTWLVPCIRQWLYSLPVKPQEFLEPFTGGGIIGLTVAFEGLAHHVTMIERDEQVSAVWETILDGGGKRLAERIQHFELTEETVRSVLSMQDVTGEELAFQTILRNRVNHGGILASGSGMIKYGENGKGLKSRWYPGTLARRILEIGMVKQRICFVQGDGMTYLRENAHRTDAVFFIDPPYTAAGKKAGKRLYTYNELDHETLFSIAETLQGDFLMTYDNAEGVRALAERHNFDVEAIAMKNTHHAEMTELLIGRNLDWVRQAAK
ncbi:MAG TPA: DNA adenine methylase [Chthonomonadaceae bacterium]|nr:DNA adenine methylase [Chthonomonadaceae bacterium]